MNPFADIKALHGWPGFLVGVALLVLAALLTVPVVRGAWLVLVDLG